MNPSYVECSLPRIPLFNSPLSQIPNEVTDYYLQRVGFECEDVRLYVVSFLTLFMVSYPLANAFFPLLPKNSFPTLPLMHTNMLVYVQTQRVGGLARPFQVLEVPRFVVASPASIVELLTSPKGQNKNDVDHGRPQCSSCRVRHQC